VLLVVDVGNTQTHFGAWEEDRLVEHWRFATVRTATADEIGAVLLNLLELRGLSFADLDASIVSSTVPVLEPEWLAMAERYLDHRMLSVGPGLRTGMALRYDNPREIGADRLVNAVAIRERFGGPAICVDFGTAVNFDVVSRAGEYLGGVLVPGVEISLDALTERGAKLPKIDLGPPRTVIGKSTVDAMRSGIVFGYASAVDGILRRIRDEMGEPEARTIATGGLARYIVPFSEEIEAVDEMLTLTGLRLVYERNASPH
jgi:type III pantothenate kinase